MKNTLYLADKATIGQLIYYCAIVNMFSLLFAMNCESPSNSTEVLITILFYLVILVIGIAFQMKHYKFNNLYIGVSYRTTLLVVMYLILNFYLHTDNNFKVLNEDPSYLRFGGALLWGTIIFSFVGAIISFPFKMLSVVFGYIDSNTETVYKENKLYFYGSNDDIHQSDNITKRKILSKFKYDTKNETELQILLKEAIENENYEEANRIKKALEKF